VEPLIQFLDPVMAIASWHNVLIYDQGGMIQSEHVRAILAKSAVMAARFPRMMAGLSLVRPDTPISPKPVRDELSSMMKETEHYEARTAVVLEATGIFASALRTTLRTMAVMSGNRKLKIVSAVADAITWVQPYVRSSDGASVAPEEIARAVQLVRAAYEDHLSHSVRHALR
jgi:hypothetical protein